LPLPSGGQLNGPIDAGGKISIPGSESARAAYAALEVGGGVSLPWEECVR